jgi:hypothetical protein
MPQFRGPLRIRRCLSDRLILGCFVRTGTAGWPNITYRCTRILYSRVVNIVSWTATWMTRMRGFIQLLSRSREVLLAA